jgi:glutamate synthase (NADPH/NADH) large chain
MTVLVNLNHRGACGCEPTQATALGINLQIPDKFFREAAAAGFSSAARRANMAPAWSSCPRTRPCAPSSSAFWSRSCRRRAGTAGLAHRAHRQQFAGGDAQAGEPFIRQVFVGRNAEALVGTDPMAFERKLYVIRKRAEQALRYGGHPQGAQFYIASLSSRTIVYKGMLLADQVDAYFPDLLDPAVESAIAIVHSRFSTNTFPSWDRAHPYRYLIHNGEINTIRGNVNWMYARQSVLQSELFGADLDKIRQQIVDPDGSDSAQFDNALEFLHLAGRPLHHVAMMMIPEPWSNHESMSPEKGVLRISRRPDGAVGRPRLHRFSDGTVVGAVLDRNGLRPSRYYVTKDDMVVMASEVGVLGDEIAPENVLYKSRLQPGRMFLVDTAQGRIISDEEIKESMAQAHPYRRVAGRESGRTRRAAPAARSLPGRRPRQRPAPPARLWLHL